MSAAANKLEFLAAQMADHEANWSLGTFGAIAEFIRGADEPVALSRSGAAVAAAQPAVIALLAQGLWVSSSLGIALRPFPRSFSEVTAQ